MDDDKQNNSTVFDDPDNPKPVIKKKEKSENPIIKKI